MKIGFGWHRMEGPIITGRYLRCNHRDPTLGCWKLELDCMIRNLAVYQVFASVAWDLRWAIMGSWSDYSYSSLLVNTKLAHVGISTAAWGGSNALCCLFCVQWGVCLRTFLFSPALGLYGSIVQCSVSNGHPFHIGRLFVRILNWYQLCVLSLVWYLTALWPTPISTRRSGALWFYYSDTCTGWLDKVIIPLQATGNVFTQWPHSERLAVILLLSDYPNARPDKVITLPTGNVISPNVDTHERWFYYSDYWSSVGW